MQHGKQLCRNAWDTVGCAGSQTHTGLLNKSGNHFVVQCATLRTDGVASEWHG
jgi:hypothetical protein